MVFVELQMKKIGCVNYIHFLKSGHNYVPNVVHRGSVDF